MKIIGHLGYVNETANANILRSKYSLQQIQGVNIHCQLPWLPGNRIGISKICHWLLIYYKTKTKKIGWGFWHRTDHISLYTYYFLLCIDLIWKTSSLIQSLILLHVSIQTKQTWKKCIRVDNLPKKQSRNIEWRTESHRTKSQNSVLRLFSLNKKTLISKILYLYFSWSLYMKQLCN